MDVDQLPIDRSPPHTLRQMCTHLWCCSKVQIASKTVRTAKETWSNSSPSSLLLPAPFVPCPLPPLPPAMSRCFLPPTIPSGLHCIVGEVGEVGDTAISSLLCTVHLGRVSVATDLEALGCLPMGDVLFPLVRFFQLLYALSRSCLQVVLITLYLNKWDREKLNEGIKLFAGYVEQFCTISM